ncbi:MAG: Stk1 family PASTA domain-containing Ser/Thr kinase [Candidatus Ancillula trichonymphae]|jgi:serine/threonine-protein kinase|nr:Stk1 family PASTA domain-containing Ser/Thr kinase [Candidatus Ancillula trichonymphae]
MSNLKVLAERYEIGELIGQGGMADVYIGKDVRLGRKVAIKILKPNLAGDPVFLARFRREAQAAASLNNSNIVAVYDTGEETETSETGQVVHIPYIVMEYVEGRTVREILAQEGKLSLPDAVDIVTGVLSALEYSHKFGVIHRDIKPANIMITQTGAVKVMDFGIAHAISNSDATLSQSQSVIGTAHYLSPEQARGEAVDCRSDLYSTGCLFFEVLTGRPPFVGDSPVSIAYQHVREVAPKVTSFSTDILQVYDVIVSKALAKDANARYASAEEFLSDLNNARLGRSVTPGIASDPNATQVLSPDEVADLNASLAAGKGEGAVDGSFENVISQYSHTDEVEEAPEDDEAARKKKILIIAGSVVGALIVVGVILALIFSSKGPADNSEKVEVPSMEKASRDDVCERLERYELKCQVEDDKDSDKAKNSYTKQSPKAGERVAKNTVVKVYYSTGPVSASVPDVSGLLESDAKLKLEKAGYKVGLTKEQDCTLASSLTDANEQVRNKNACSAEKDIIVGTEPASGQAHNKGEVVKLYKATGNVILPNLSGMTLDKATAVLNELQLPFTSTEVDKPGHEGQVVAQSPAVSVVTRKTPVTIQVAKKKSKVTIPNLMGKSTTYAKDLLESLGLIVNIGYDTTATQKDVVTGVVPQEGTQVDRGSSVKIYIGNPSTPTPSPSTPAAPTNEPTSGNS